MLDHHHGIRAGRQEPTRRDRDRFPGRDAAVKNVTHRHGANHVQHDGEQVRGGVHVGGMHGVTVHHRPPFARQVGRRGERFGQHPAGRRVGGDTFLPDGRRVRQDSPRLVGRNQLQPVRLRHREPR